MDPKQTPLVSRAMKSVDVVGGYLGFSDRAATLLWLVGAPVTCIVALVRAPLLTDRGMQTMAAPGEMFALRDVRANFILHLALIILWCFLGVLQFVPAVRKALSFQYHRLAGRAFLCISVGVAASGLSMASRAFGGHFTGQVGIFVLFLAFLLAAVNGYWSIRVRNIPAHRDWMIRLFAYGTSVITLRLFMMLGLQISNAMGLHATSRCDAIESLLGGSQTSQLFPACGEPVVDGTVVVAIRSSFATAANTMAGLQLGYDAGVLLALFLHACLAELWIRYKYYARKAAASGNDSRVLQAVSSPSDVFARPPLNDSYDEFLHSSRSEHLVADATLAETCS